MTPSEDQPSQLTRTPGSSQRVSHQPGPSAHVEQRTAWSVLSSLRDLRPQGAGRLGGGEASSQEQGGRKNGVKNKPVLGRANTKRTCLEEGFTLTECCIPLGKWGYSLKQTCNSKGPCQQRVRTQQQSVCAAVTVVLTQWNITTAVEVARQKLHVCQAWVLLPRAGLVPSVGITEVLCSTRAVSGEC